MFSERWHAARREFCKTRKKPLCHLSINWTHHTRFLPHSPANLRKKRNRSKLVLETLAEVNGARILAWEHNTLRMCQWLHLRRRCGAKFLVQQDGESKHSFKLWISQWMKWPNITTSVSAGALVRTSITHTVQEATHRYMSSSVRGVWIAKARSLRNSVVSWLSDMITIEVLNSWIILSEENNGKYCYS